MAYSPLLTSQNALLRKCIKSTHSYPQIWTIHRIQTDIECVQQEEYLYVYNTTKKILKMLFCSYQYIFIYIYTTYQHTVSTIYWKDAHEYKIYVIYSYQQVHIIQFFFFYQIQFGTILREEQKNNYIQAVLELFKTFHPHLLDPNRTNLKTLIALSHTTANDFRDHPVHTHHIPR